MEKIGKHNYEAFMLDYMEGNLDESGINALFAFFEQNPELKPEFPEDQENISLEPEPVFYSDKKELKRIDEEKEEQVVAYIEGQLKKAEKAEFEKEVQLNPLMQLMLNDYKKIILIPANDISFDGKRNLKRTPVAEEKIIAYSENILMPAEKEEMDLQLKQDVVAADLLNVYAQLKVKADFSIVFSDKESLKRRTLVVYLNNYWKPLSLAASVVLLLGLFWIMKGFFVTNTEDKTNNSLAAKQAVTYWKQHLVNSENDVAVISPFNNYSNYAISNTSVVDRVKKDSSTRDHNSGNNVVQQIIANNTVSNHPADTGKNPENPLAIINLKQDQISYNYYSEKDEELTGVKNTTLTTRDYVTKKITEAAWGEEEAFSKNQGLSSASEEKRKLKGFDVLALIGKGLKKLGNKKSDAKKVELEQGTEYIVTIGGVSVTRREAN